MFYGVRCCFMLLCSTFVPCSVPSFPLEPHVKRAIVDSCPFASTFACPHSQGSQFPFRISLTPRKMSNCSGRAVLRTVDSLRKHPVYRELNLSVPPEQLARLSSLGSLAFQDPLIVTSEGVVIDGYARREYAEQHGFSTVSCFELDIDEDDALRVILGKHRRSAGWNDYNRIRIASRLKTLVREQAIANQQIGGRLKGLSKLTQASVRKEIARAAGVSEGNVSKVAQLSNADMEVQKALVSGEIRIHRAWLWSRLDHGLQRERLREHRLEKLKLQVKTMMRNSAGRRQSKSPVLTLAEFQEKLSAASGSTSLPESVCIIPVDTIKFPVVCVPIELYRLFYAD